MATSSDRDTTAVIADIDVNETRSYVEWPAVFAGAVIATALSLLLTMFGSSMGLFVASPWSPGGFSAETLGIAAAIWFAITHIYSVGMGGYFAGRMRPRSSTFRSDEVSFRDGTNGLVVWALSLLFTAWLAANIVGGAAQVAGQTAATAIGGASQLIGPAAEQAGDRIWRSLAEAAQRPPEDQQQGQPAQPGQAAQPAPPAQGQEVRAPTQEERDEVLRILRRGLVAGQISEQDRNYLAQLVERTTGMSAEQAEERVRTTITQATEEAKQATETARKTAAFSGFWAAVVLLLSGLAAWWAASLGGSHRDEATPSAL